MLINQNVGKYDRKTDTYILLLDDIKYDCKKCVQN